MHEFSIADSLMEQLRELAVEHGLPSIDRVELEVGELRQVIPEILQLAFSETVQGSMAEGAELVIEEIEASAQCRRCEQVFRPTTWDHSCPVCGVADAQILTGDSLVLKSIESNQTTEPAIQ